jgi:hypothetical protein
VPKIRPLFAVFFAFGGLLVGYALWGLSTLAHMESGMSDGTVRRDGIHIVPLIAFFETFFLSGIVASLFPRVVVRYFMAIIAHGALFLAVLYLGYGGLSPLNVVTVCIVLIVVLYAPCWVVMVRSDTHPE